MTTIETLVKDIEEIKQRNTRVEIDKAWETSTGLYIIAVGIELPWLNAVVPSVGFFLSTLALSIFKNFWIKNTKNLNLSK